MVGPDQLSALRTPCAGARPGNWAAAPHTRPPGLPDDLNEALGTDWHLKQRIWADLPTAEATGAPRGPDCGREVRAEPTKERAERHWRTR